MSCCRRQPVQIYSDEGKLTRGMTRPRGSNETNPLFRRGEKRRQDCVLCIPLKRGTRVRFRGWDRKKRPEIIFEMHAVRK